MKILALVSPHMKGPEVTQAQKLLRKNVFEQDYLQGEIDGEFGTETMRACKRAKYWLGYGDGNQSGAYGGYLADYLSGKRQLGKDMKLRRKARLKKAAETPLRLKALAEMKKDIGMHEQPPESNCCATSHWWGFCAAWCAMQVSKAYITAGSKAFSRGRNWAYVPAMLAAAVAGEHGLSLTRNPQPGDAVPFDWDNDGIADHIGVMDTPVGSDGYFHTIEGNTSLTNNSNGGEVQRRNRHISDVAQHNGRAAFIHIGK